MQYPKARVEGLVITETVDGCLVYDQARHELHGLNMMSTRIWRLCDGTQNSEALAAIADLDEGAVRLALDLLAESKLIYGYSARNKPGSRRALMRKVGIVAVPAIVSVTIPLAAANASNCIELFTAGEMCDPATLPQNCCKPDVEGNATICTPIGGGQHLCRSPS